MQLGVRQPNNKFQVSLLPSQQSVIVPNHSRSCTDIFCCILFFILMLGFLGLMAYGIIKGDPNIIIDVYNDQQVRCASTSGFTFGYFTTIGSANNAICVSTCPTQQSQPVSCLPDASNCPSTGTYSSTYPTIPFDDYCIPSTSDISQFFTTNTLQLWSNDLRQGWPILLIAAGAGLVLSMIFLLIVRCCAGCIIWLMIGVSILCMQAVGILFILQAKGISISPVVSNQIGSINYNSLIIIGSVLIGVGVLLLLLVICLRSRIAMGVKAVQISAIFLFQNCPTILLPITQAIFLVAALGATIVGVAFLLSLGTTSFPNKIQAFPTLSFSEGQLVMIGFCVAGGIWTIFFFHGCNQYMICSAVSIWYFNHDCQGESGRPLCDSLFRLIRYVIVYKGVTHRFNMGSVALTSLINGVLFIIKLIVAILSFQAKQEDNNCVSILIKCMNCLLCVCKIILRFLNNAVYVQISIQGTNYCTSSMTAFNLITDNAVKLAITDGISIFFTILGILGITLAITVGAYFACIQIQQFAQYLSSPIIVTIGSGVIGFVVSCVYLAMLDVCAQAVVQCYLVDLGGGSRSKYASQRFKDILEA